MTGLSRYCLCGAALHARSRPASTAQTLAAVFAGQHTGDGHGPATPAQAAAARRRAARQETR